ncbi:hypothetical protein ETB97_003893 [Aspergillus alliaceus]|uniref:Uncharacterized protein n=1 Tax=Petromyces alliaceus TaxID=209559 RepID=A0A8H6E508_PETAA|nr:hypothetical protein ETB97_003893 [Aspergillus burnettii]
MYLDFLFSLYAIEFDDEVFSLTVVNNITTASSGGSKWIAVHVVISTTLPRRLHHHTQSSAHHTVPAIPGAITVDRAGALEIIVGTTTYGNSPGAHGLALDTDGTFIYSADGMGHAD